MTSVPQCLGTTWSPSFVSSLVLTPTHLSPKAFLDTPPNVTKLGFFFSSVSIVNLLSSDYDSLLGYSVIHNLRQGEGRKD